MDLLVEKLDGSRYYLSQYKVLITDFEESAPSVTRNSKQLDQRNGNIDFGGWHTDKTINITGYYRADDIDEEETLREKLYALLSDPDGYYITQLKTTPSVAMERPGETSGGYYDKLKDYPSHKRFLVYTEAPEMELVGNVNGTLLYKLTAEFKTMKLPYGETPAVDVAIDSPYKDVPVNLLNFNSGVTLGKYYGWPADIIAPSISRAYFKKVKVTPNNQYTISADWSNTLWLNVYAFTNESDTTAVARYGAGGYLGSGSWDSIFSGGYTISKTTTFTVPANVNYIGVSYSSISTDTLTLQALLNGKLKLEPGSTATPWSPNPADPEYNSWYYSLAGNVSVPYSGSVPCNQLEQGFTVQFTATGSASSVSFKINDTELTYSGAIASGDVFMFSGFSYTQNGLSIVSKTNKAYFILQPDKPNRITCNVHGTVRILGLQNLYA